MWPNKFQLMGSPGVSTADIYSIVTSAAFPEIYIEIQGLRTIVKIVREIDHSGALVNNPNKDISKNLIIKQAISLSSGEKTIDAYVNPYFLVQTVSMDLYLTLDNTDFEFIGTYDRFEIKTCYAEVSNLFGPTYCLGYDF